MSEQDQRRSLKEKRDPKNIGTDALRAFEKLGLRPIFGSFGLRIREGSLVPERDAVCAISALALDIQSEGSVELEDYHASDNAMIVVQKAYGIPGHVLVDFMNGYDDRATVVDDDESMYEQGQAVREFVLASREAVMAPLGSLDILR